jgi:hypothetical protein
LQVDENQACAGGGQGDHWGVLLASGTSVSTVACRERNRY